MISSANSMKLGHSQNWSTIELSFRRRYPDFLRLFSILDYILQSDWCRVFRILKLSVFFIMLRIIRVSFIFIILAYFSESYQVCSIAGILLQSNDIRLVLFGIVQNLYSKKCRRCLYFGYCSVDLGALPIVIHILIGIIPVHVLFVFILPLIEIARTQFF